MTEDTFQLAVFNQEWGWWVGERKVERLREMLIIIKRHALLHGENLLFSLGSQASLI